MDKTQDLIYVDPLVLEKWNCAVPRYTSYPTAPQFQSMGPETYIQHIERFDQTAKKPLSLYIHIPFCKSMCLFCGCSVVLNRSPERQTRYLQHLHMEIEKIASYFSQKRTVTQLHFGGGTPTSLSIEELKKLMEHIRAHFVFSKEAEISIEIDPRTVFADQGDKLCAIKEFGFTRVSFGVQDLDPLVQEAVRRRQSEEMTVSTFFKAKELGFEGINIDLIYGLPHQSVKSFAKTAERLIELKPDRIAFYSYASVPWLKKHQRAIPDETLPKVSEKFQIYVDARRKFMEGGYIAIGMDHFSLPTDAIAVAYQQRQLTRNFQGYSIAKAEDMIGFGLTSIGFLENGYFQNEKELEIYQQKGAAKQLPISKGYVLNADDILRRNIILSLMCHFEVDEAFAPLGVIDPLLEEGFLEIKDKKLIATPLGRLFIRNIAAAFDAYLKKGQFSRAV